MLRWAACQSAGCSAAQRRPPWELYSRTLLYTSIFKGFLGLEMSYMYINLYPAKLIKYTSHQLEVVYRHRDPQLQVS